MHFKMHNLKATYPWLVAFFNLINRAAITDVLTQYSYRWDSKDSAGFAELFTEDGILEREVNGETINTATIKGREAIYNYAKTSHEGRLADRQSRHHFSGIVFLDLNETTAVTEIWLLLRTKPKKMTPLIFEVPGII